MKSWPEKWNYSFVIRGKKNNKIKSMFATPHINKNYRVPSLKWDDAERDIIKKVISIIKKMFKVDGFPTIKIHQEQIILLDEKVFMEHIADSGQAACFLNGYIYICRHKNKGLFLNHLTHELAHLISYYSLHIKSTINKQDHKNEFMIYVSKVGYSCFEANRCQLYEGLNEAVTDIYSKYINELFVKMYPELLTEEEQVDALCRYGYEYHVGLLREILFNLSSNADLAPLMIRSYIDGSNDFIEALNIEMPSVLEALKNIDATEESVFEAAEVIGGKALKHKIQHQ